MSLLSLMLCFGIPAHDVDFFLNIFSLPLLVITITMSVFLFVDDVSSSYETTTAL